MSFSNALKAVRARGEKRQEETKFLFVFEEAGMQDQYTQTQQQREIPLGKHTLHTISEPIERFTAGMMDNRD